MNAQTKVGRRNGIYGVVLLGTALALGGCTLLTGGMAPSVPGELTVTVGEFADRVRVVWGPVAEATGYEVWRSTSATGAYQLVATTGHCAYDDTGVIPETTYWYKVRACNRAGCSQFTPPQSGKAASGQVPAVPTGLTASQGTFTDRVRITWQASPRATEYALYRGLSQTGSFTLLTTVQGTSYDDLEVVLGTPYWYRVRACGAGGCSVLSDPVSGFATSQVPPAPQELTASDGTENGKVVVTWQAVSGAVNYLVYRALSADGTPALLATVEETTYEDTAVTVGTTYWYWVRACNASGCGPLAGPESGTPGGNGEEPPPPPPGSTSL